MPIYAYRTVYTVTAQCFADSDAEAREYIRFRRKDDLAQLRAAVPGYTVHATPLDTPHPEDTIADDIIALVATGPQSMLAIQHHLRRRRQLLGVTVAQLVASGALHRESRPRQKGGALYHRVP